MNAIRVHQPGGPEELKFESVTDPVAGAGRVLIELHAIGVNPVETYIRAGKYGQKEWPYTPGADGAGVVRSVGAGVDQFKAGDRVYTAGSVTGTYAELTVAPAARVFHLPANATFQQGAALGVPYSTAHRALFHRANLRAGETVFIHGASGGVGAAATQMARAVGATVIGTASTDRGRRLVTENGADHVLDHSAPAYLDDLMKLTGGKGVDVVLEMLANVNLARDLTIVARNGRVIIVGNRGTIEINPRDAMMREADIRGVTLMNATDEDVRASNAAIAAGLESGSLRPVIGTEIPLKNAAQAHEAILQPGSYGKIILIP